jgi:citrate lyase gamma subunit
MTLRALQKIKKDERLRKLNNLASLAPSNRGRLNQSIGAKVKEALGAEIQRTVNDNPKTRQVRDQLISSYTRLRPGR